MVNITCRGGNVNADTVSFRGKIKKSFRRILDSAKALSFSQCNIRVKNRIELFLKNLRQGDTVYIQPEAEYHPSAMLQSIINAGMIPGHEFSGVVTETGRGADADWTGRGVGVFPLIHCGECLPCRKRYYELCRLAEKRMDPQALITHGLRLEELERGLHIMRDKTEDYVKIMGIL